MKITLCGSMHHINTMKEAKGQLEDLGYEVEIPDPRDGEVSYDSLGDKERANLKETLIQEHLAKISDSDAVFIFNEDKKGIKGYIGGNTLVEIAFAYSQEIEIFLLKEPTEVSYIDEILGMKPIILENGVESIDTYFRSLPTTYVSSKSPIKQRAVSRALRRIGIPTNVLPHPTTSDVNEQPKTIDETYAGAENRHRKLQEETRTLKPAYLATIESGWAQLHDKHNYFGCIVVVLEKIGTMQKMGIYLELELPKDMTDKIPSIYPDMGVLVQKEYGSKLKDPVPYQSNGMMTRLQLTESAVFTVATQFAEKANNA